MASFRHCYHYLIAFVILIKSTISSAEKENSFPPDINENIQPTFAFSKSDSSWRVFKRITMSSVDGCKTECEQRPTCMAVAYQRRSLVCHLLATHSKGTTIRHKGTVLITGFNTKKTKPIPGVGTVHNITECDIIYSPYTLSGNMYAVGNTVMFSGKSNGIDLYLNCEKNGQWTRKRKESMKQSEGDMNALTFECSDITGPSGIYWDLETSTPVFCDMDTDDGHWLVFQRREDGSVDFYRNWSNYTAGFGNVGGEFWIGLQPLYEKLVSGSYELRIDMDAFNGTKGFAKYSSFKLTGPDENYRLEVYGFTGNVGDSLSDHSGFEFTTFDRDNDLKTRENCAITFKGAWWYNYCHFSNLNGMYSHCVKTCPYAQTVIWFHWLKYHTSLKGSEMKIRQSFSVR